MNKIYPKLENKKKKELNYFLITIVINADDD